MQAKKSIIRIFLILLIIVLTSCTNDISKEENSEKEIIVMDNYTSYTGYTSYESALDTAHTVVYGTIKDIGEPYEADYGDEKYVIKHYFTPITIEVAEYIKGENNASTVVFEAQGAEYKDVIYDYKAYDTLNFEIGDKILVFLSKRNQSIGPQCVISEDENGKATRVALGENKEADTLREQVELVKNTYTKMLADRRTTE